MTLTWNNSKITKIDLSITNFCNAGCPQCDRTNPNGCGVDDWLPLTQWTLQDFKKAFPKDSLNQLGELQFCGTWGDPMMLKDIYSICEYIITESDCNIEITTNGSIREDTFYWELGALCGNRLKMHFDVDGIDQDMHSHYRRKTNLQKTLNNMEMLSRTLAIPMAQTVVFEHNRPYLKQIEELARSYGAVHYKHFDSNRFEYGDTFNFIDENGKEQTLRK